MMTATSSVLKASAEFMCLFIQAHSSRWMMLSHSSGRSLKIWIWAIVSLCPACPSHPGWGLLKSSHHSKSMAFLCETQKVHMTYVLYCFCQVIQYLCVWGKGWNFSGKLVPKDTSHQDMTRYMTNLNVCLDMLIAIVFVRLVSVCFSAVSVAAAASGCVCGGDCVAGRGGSSSVRSATQASILSGPSHPYSAHAALLLSAWMSQPAHPCRRCIDPYLHTQISMLRVNALYSH